MSAQIVEHLTQEHAEIRKVVSAFENFLRQSESKDAPDRHELWALLDALTESLLLCHEEKEESVLLPELNRMGLSWSDGTLAHVRHDHRRGRYLMRSLRHAAHQAQDWSSEERRHFLSIGKEWVEFMRHHMDHEESLLFPYLDANLQPETDQKLVAGFDAIDRDFNEMADASDLNEQRAQFTQKYFQ